MDPKLLLYYTDYPAYIDVNYHECMFFVCETLYINVYIQTGNKTHRKLKVLLYYIYPTFGGFVDD